MSFWRFAYWSLRTADWAVIGGLTFGVSVIGYSIWDYQQTHQKQAFDPSPSSEPEKAGRFGAPFPLNKDDYTKQSKEQMTLEELEWNIKDRERQYQQYIKQHPKS